MATEDPLALPEGWSSLSKAAGAPEQVRVASFGLDEFDSESGETAPPPVVAPPAVESAATADPRGVPSPVTIAPDAVTLVDLIDRRETMEWREAVAVIRRLCLELKDHPSEYPVVLDPRQIQLTRGGDVKVIPGVRGGDALVIQIGRLLRSLLLNKPVPAEVRLILSQATFEVPIFDSVDDLSRALGQVSTLEETDGVASAYAKALRPRADGDSAAAQAALSVSARPILPAASQRAGRPLLARMRRRRDDALLAATVAVGSAACAVLIAAHWSSRVTPTRDQAPSASVPAVDAGAQLPASTPASASSAPSGSRGALAPLPRPPVESAAGGRAVEAGAAPNVARGAPPAIPRTAATPPPTDVSRDAAQRAIALVQAGKPLEAEIAFDALVLNNPLYEPTRSEMTPQAFAAFQASRRSLLPAIATRDLGRARAALQEGDLDRAMAIATSVGTMLERGGFEEPVELRRQLRALLDDIDVRANIGDVIYTADDAGIVPPRPLSRQFPLNPPAGVRADRVGVLELVVGKQGDVELVKLHTPLNRYHERMVVSAAKAWRYRPARKDGVPVRYRLAVTINLPESGGGQN